MQVHYFDRDGNHLVTHRPGGPEAAVCGAALVLYRDASGMLVWQRLGPVMTYLLSD